ncbi:MAG TPA: hypothetical protein VKN36_14925 [Eudoraea sp.]|nr:hypothetical protein [Eudoraea sp.]
MEENKDKRLDDLIRRSVREMGLDTPPANFTENLLFKIETIPRASDAIVYTPLISRFGWGIIAAIVIALGVLIGYANPDARITWFEKINWSEISNVIFPEGIPSLSLSNTMVYSLLIFAVFAVVQSVLLKNYLGRKYAIR